MPLPKSDMGCPMDSILRLMMGPWTTYILWVLRSHGPSRFSELKRRVSGISAKVLTERLRTLEGAEIIERRQHPENAGKVTYAMAQRGQELFPVLDQLSALGKAWRADDHARAATALTMVQAPARDAKAA
jgi:DNA-binding HxlR family transcriptional regulator